MTSTAVDPSGTPIPTSSVLIAASKHIVVRCRAENMAFIKCKRKDQNPEKCLDKGREVTHCKIALQSALLHRTPKLSAAFQNCSPEIYFKTALSGQQLFNPPELSQTDP
ncbi:NADH dehydrogenase [ubiquinone] 1 alpha subcomplex subunit 8-A [Platanthera zijinensis]|uniref:NADH dehydrogenase [ubiquinone] 1 alpha subcomplex subunit 8-A n=1 Tax=Platanthera zijinensis TaxID=2320716 RepID=A0AAP0B5N6_9ASPA